VAKDDAHARDLDEHACAGGYADGCGGLGVLLAAGRGGPKDAARAADLLKTACDAVDPSPAPPDSCTSWMIACATLADLYTRGDGVPADPKRAAALAELGPPRCDALRPPVSSPSPSPTPVPVPAHAPPPAPAPAPKPSPDLGY
jgi:hypothetical protein